MSATGFFDQALQVNVPKSNLEFRVYYTAPKAEDPTVMVCHHGAGWSGLTFACFAKEVAAQAKGECGVMAFDMRGHGALPCCFDCAPRYTQIPGKTTSTTGMANDQQDLSIETLIGDFVNLISGVYRDPAAAPTLLVRFTDRSSLCNSS